MRILIIGATGLVGPYVTEELGAAGHETICLNRRGVNPSGGEGIQCDRRDNKILREKIIEVNPDIIIDMIPMTEEAAIALGEIIEEIRKPLIACSSIDIYKAHNILHRIESPPYQQCPIREVDELRTVLTADGKRYDKLNVEKQYLSLNTDVTVFRLPAIYGWPDTFRIKGYVDQIQQDNVVRMHPKDAKWRFSRALNTNCGYAVSLGINQNGKQIFNVAEPVHYTEEEWCRKIGSHLNWEGEIILDPSIEDKCDYDQAWYVDTANIRSTLGYDEKYDCNEGLKQNIEKYVNT